MPRAKKDGEKISLYLDKDVIERLRAYADEKGQTLTMAMERAIKAFLDAEDTEHT
ncbi:MAG: ribbon-helix-helix protein, CopG family [Treponema sp.]|nr:ribbon-helix-helix protein, CopG family [Treponema sp.]